MRRFSILLLFFRPVCLLSFPPRQSPCCLTDIFRFFFRFANVVFASGCVDFRFYSANETCKNENSINFFLMKQLFYRRNFVRLVVCLSSKSFDDTSKFGLFRCCVGLLLVVAGFVRSFIVEL